MISKARWLRDIISPDHVNEPKIALSLNRVYDKSEMVIH